MKLLHIDSSILGDNSVSRKVSAAAVASLARTIPDLEVTHRDLAAQPIAHLSNPATLAGDNPYLEEFLGADIVVIGAPMYNFSVSSQLKAWIDRILVAGKTFRYGANGVEGLARGKRVVIALARGGFYDGASAAEHLETYLRTVFGFIGIAPEFVIAEGIATGAAQREKALGEALKVAVNLPADHARAA